MKTLIKLAYCAMLSLNVMAMEGLEDSSAGYRTRMRIEQVDSALDSAVSWNNLDELDFLLRGGAGVMPSQGGVDSAFSWAASMKRGAIIAFMADHPTIRPDLNCITAAYYLALENRQEETAIQLELIISRALGSEGDGEHEISPTLDSLPRLDKFIGVFENIYKVLRVERISLVSYDEARDAVEQAIMNIIPEVEQDEVMQYVCYRRLDGKIGYQNQLRIVLTFIRHKKKDEQLWLEGFVREFSRDSGIKKSIIRSLMNIDPDLDSLFKEKDLGESLGS